MKKIVLISALMAFTVSFASAQLKNPAPPAPISGDFTGAGPSYSAPVQTVTNTGADSIRAKVGPGINNFLFQSITFQANIVLTSGTGAGKVKLWASAEPSTVTTPSYACIDSFTVTNVAKQVYSKTITGNPFTNYMVTFTGSGTEVLTINPYMLFR
jgi:hypothetical protein